MKLLCAICSCWWREEYTKFQRETWAKKTDGIDIRFFFGEGATREPKEDEVFLNCADNYHGLPVKVKGAFTWALNNGYDYAFKCDDDTYVVPERLVQADLGDYVGRYMEPCHGYPYGFCSGGAGYWLSRHAMRIISQSEVTDVSEDRWVANSLGPYEIVGHNDPRYRVAILKSDYRGRRDIRSQYVDYPRAGNKVISCCEFAASAMLEPHNSWLESQAKIQAARSKVTFL